MWQCGGTGTAYAAPYRGVVAAGGLLGIRGHLPQGKPKKLLCRPWKRAIASPVIVRADIRMRTRSESGWSICAITGDAMALLHGLQQGHACLP